jgi:two-component system NarL family sensor kinase
MPDDVAPRWRPPWIARMVAAVLAALFALGSLLALRAGHPSDATVVNTDAGAWRTDGVVVTFTVGEDSPLRAGDLVTGINGLPLTARDPDPPEIGDVVVYSVVRDGTAIEVPVTLTDYPFGELLLHHAPALLYLLSLVLLSAFVAARRPRDPAAIALFLISLCLIAGTGSYAYGTQVIDLATGRVWLTTVAEVANCGLWAALLHFTLSFPQPWPVLRRRPWLAGVPYLLPLLGYAAVLTLRLPQAEGLPRTWLLTAVSVPAAGFFPLLVLGAVIASYVLAPDAPTRQRMRLVSYGLGLIAGAYLVLGRIPAELLGHPLVPWPYLSVVFLPAQLLLAAAVLRYRLWDIQIVLRRSLVYGLVTVTLVGAYYLLATLVGAAIGTQVGLVPVLLALAVALSFSAARTALRRVVSRLVYGEREDPYEVLRQLGQRLESATTAEATLNQLVATLARTLRLAHAAIEVPGLALSSTSSGTTRPGGEGSAPPPGGPGSPRPSATSIELVHDGELIGRLVLDPGPDREPFGPSDQRLLDGLARQAGATAHGLLLAARLQRSLEGTVTVLEEERRRLRREIHDGLGPTLASASMRLELGRALLRTDPETAERIFTDLAEVHRALVGDIRRLIDGLRPAALDQLGLAGALHELVDRLAGGTRTRLVCDIGTDPLPAAVEVAAYRIVSEGLTNVVRHAVAETCEIRLWRDIDFHIEISDDGQGLPAVYHPGVGLTSIRERCAELGGQASIAPAAPHGTILRCRLPVASATGPLPATPKPAPPTVERAFASAPR